MALLTKVIKPKKLSSASMRMTLINEMKAVAKEVTADFQATTATWDHKPKFVTVMTLQGPGPEVLVGTDDEIYRYVDEGTKPHPIPKAGPGLLAFSEGYTAKTVPGVLSSRSGGPYGRTLVRITQVMHPGTDPRHFDKMIQKKWSTLFKRRMEAAMVRAAKASGHGM